MGVLPKYQRLVFRNPGIQIRLQLIDLTIHFLAEGNTVELVEHGLVKTWQIPLFCGLLFLVGE